ncbi:hypothetical protein [uncultured Bosea sp.]|uniref:hypothetical protein n=1 Tax=uncultured Bosea sp. TaxID=211457 RepID=UPI0025E7DF7C|nr:hypothetical protein [uncultured Bosea sp.]
MADDAMNEVLDLLRSLSNRGIVFLRETDMPAACRAHDQGWIAINQNAAQITPEGRAAVAAAQ